MSPALGRLGLGVATAVGVVGVATGRWVVAVGVALVAAAVVGALGDRRRRHERDRREAAVHSVVERVEAEVRAGSALTPAVRRALADVHGLHPHLDLLGQRLAVGRPLVDALSEPVADATADEVSSLVVTTLVVVAERGGRSDAALSRLTDALLARSVARAEAHAAAAQVRASAAVLVALPVVFAGVAATVDGDVRRIYLASPAGAVCVALAGALDLLAWRWMHRIVAA